MDNTPVLLDRTRSWFSPRAKYKLEAFHLTSPVEVEDDVEDLWVSVEEELIVLDNVVVTKVQFLVVVRVRGQPTDSGLWIASS